MRKRLLSAFCATLSLISVLSFSKAGTYLSFQDSTIAGLGAAFFFTLTAISIMLVAFTVIITVIGGDQP